MNENYQPVALVIKDWLKFAVGELKQVDIDSARLDAEIILAHSLKKNRTYLHAHIDEILSDRTKEIADARLALRLDHVPIAYIIGHKEFYGRKFVVTTATLIPRPESETIIELLKEVLPKKQSLFGENVTRLVDVGTGSGCLGITAKLEIPELQVTLLDVSAQALTIAKKNANMLKADVELQKSNLLNDYLFTPEVIIANLPYVDPSWDRSRETDYEPGVALFANQDGLSLIYKLIDQSEIALKSTGILILESDTRQHDEIIKYASKNNFNLLKKSGFCLAFGKI